MKENLQVSGLKGHCKISTFRDGELVKTTNKNNFVTKIGKEMLRRLQAVTVGGISGVDSSTIKYGNSDRIFDRLILSTDSTPSTPDDIFLEGDMVGRAGRTNANSSSDPLEGRINPTESYVTPYKTHLVFDFGTDKANGVFHSLGFLALGPTGVSGVSFNEDSLSDNLSNYRQGFNIGRVFYLGNIQSYRNIKTINLDSLEISTIEHDEVIRSLFQVKDKYYLLNSSGAIKELSSDFKSTVGLPVTLSKSIPNIDSVLVVEDKIYVTSTSSAINPDNDSRYREQLYVFDLDFNFIESIVLDQSVFGSTSYTNNVLTRFPNNRIALYLHQRSSMLYNTATKVITRYAEGIISTILDEENDKMFIFPNANQINRYLPSGLTTKIVLDEPFEKLPTETMKIEYDFTY